MKQEHTTTQNEIVSQLYKAYGSGSGVLFGITDKAAVEAIVNFALDYSAPLPPENKNEGTVDILEGDYEGKMDVEYKMKNIANAYHREYAYLRLNGRRLFVMCGEDKNKPMEKDKSDFLEKLAMIWNDYHTPKQQ